MQIFLKKRMPDAAVILTLILVLACLSGCWANIPGSRNQPAVQKESNSAVESNPSPDESDPLPTVRYALRSEEISMGEVFPAHGIFLESGTLNYTVTGARVLGPDSDVTFTIDRFFPYCNVPGVAKYPDFLDEAGHLSPGCYLVQADITVENVDAKTMEEEYGDPCLFRADDLFLVNLDSSGSTTMDYFSLAGEYEAHPMLYRLEPGNTISYTIGFLVGENWAVDGAASVRISQSSDLNGLKVDLQLGGSGHESR